MQPNLVIPRFHRIFAAEIKDIAFLVCRGGWPSATTKNTRAALRQAYDYYDAVVKTDISRVDKISRNSERTKLLLRSYARSQGGQVSIGAIRQDMMENDDETLADKTVQSYIGALKKIFVIEDMPAWNPNLRSKTAIRSAETRYFVDPSIAVAALGLGPDDLSTTWRLSACSSRPYAFVIFVYMQMP